MHHPAAAYGNGTPAAPSPYGFPNPAVTGGAPNNSSSGGNGGGNGNGYDAIAAQILNSFGGSQLSPNLIHPDLAKQQQQQEESQPALNLSRPSSPSRNSSSNNNNNNNSRDLAASSGPSSVANLSNAVPMKPVHPHQPRGPTIDSRTTGDVDLCGSKPRDATQAPPAVDLSRVTPPTVQSADQASSFTSRLPPSAPNPSNQQQPLHHRLPFNPAALAATSTPTLPVPKAKSSSSSSPATGATTGEGSGTNSILLDVLSREPTKLSGIKRRLSNSNSDSPKMKLKRLREDGGGREAAPSPSFLVEGAGDDDPYSFENEEREATIQLTKFGSAAAKESKSAAAGPVYKFKNALLSRESRTNSTESRSSTGSGSNFRATVFDRCERAFVSSCDALLDDLNSKSVAVSLRPNMDTYRDRLAARREKNANRGRKRKVPLEESGGTSLLDTSGDHDEDAVGDGSVVEELTSVGEGDVTAGGDSKIFSDDEEAPLRPPTSSKSKKDKKAASTPKKSPGKKKVNEEAETKEDSASNKATPNGVASKPSSEDLNKPPKKGGLWALPIVPKLPQKPEKKQNPTMTPPGIKQKGPPTVIKPRILKKEMDLSEVWRQAFGANKQQSTKKEAAEIKSEMKRESVSATSEQATKAKVKKTFLDVKPEVRRRRRPSFGGLIHFAPDWEQRVRRHHQKCRIPDKLMRGMLVKPRILKYNSSSSATSSSSSTPIREKFEAPSISPQDSKRSLHPSNVHLSPPELLACSEMAAAGSSKKTSDQEDSSDIPYSVVDAILEKRRLRHQAGARGYKQPSRKDRTVAFDKLPEDGLGLMATPGLPLLTTETTEVLMETSNFGNFRRQTLLRYLDCLDDSAELKSKVLDWRPEVLETKTRRQASEAKTASNHREIFGLDLEEAEVAREEAEALAEVAEAEARREQDEAMFAQNAPASPTPSSPQSTFTTPETPSPSKKKPKKSKKKKETAEKQQQQQQPQEQEQNPTMTPPGIKEKPQPQSKKQPQQQQVQQPQQQQQQQQEQGTSGPKEVKAKRPYKKKKTKDAEDAKKEAAGPSIPHWKVILNKADEAASAPAPEEEEPEESEYTPTEEEEQLQNNLQGFALDLLDDNLSWSKRQVIQNLVIWEPVDPAGVLLPPAPPKYKKKAKKYKKKHSGMDFNKKKSGNSKSRDASRAASEERDATDGGDKPRQIRYTMENVDTECKELVIDKGAGETILHRAAKMGYPDVVAYALDVLGMPPAIKDNAGVGPVHKAAFRGHADVVEILMRFGVDPNTNVKGTRPLHEALENGAVSAVASLLRYGADPLLYDYSGNMPIDLTEGDEDMRAYLSAVLADLHGKDAKRWNVSHEPNFYLPPTSLDGDENVIEEVQSQDDADSSSDEFGFEMTSHHPMPPYFKFPDRQGQYVLLSDLRTHKGATDNRLKSIVTIEMSREDFVRTSRCCLLGYSYHKVKPDESGSDKLTLVQVDGNVKKMLGVEGAHSPTKHSSSPSKPKLSSPPNPNPASSPPSSSSPAKSVIISPISSPASSSNTSPTKGGKKRKASSSSSSANA